MTGLILLLLLLQGGGWVLARPRKWRKVCSLPDSDRFGPLDVQADSTQFVTMTVDEYETIRLIDLEGLTQEECAEQMQIARTTVQRIYSEARKKIAESLIEGKILRIEGGDFKLCQDDGSEKPCGSSHCRRHGQGGGQGRGKGGGQGRGFRGNGGQIQ